MAPVFVDTSIWYAAADDGDADCEVARSLLSEHAGTLVTSDFRVYRYGPPSAARRSRFAHRSGAPVGSTTGARQAGCSCCQSVLIGKSWNAASRVTRVSDSNSAWAASIRSKGSPCLLG